MSVRCMIALFRYQAMQDNVVAQLVDHAQANHKMLNIRDEEIVDLNAHIDQLESPVEERDTLLREREMLRLHFWSSSSMPFRFS